MNRHEKQWNAEVEGIERELREDPDMVERERAEEFLGELAKSFNGVGGDTVGGGVEPTLEQNADGRWTASLSGDACPLEDENGDPQWEGVSVSATGASPLGAVKALLPEAASEYAGLDRTAMRAQGREYESESDEEPDRDAG